MSINPFEIPTLKLKHMLLLDPKTILLLRPIKFSGILVTNSVDVVRSLQRVKFETKLRQM